MRAAVIKEFNAPWALQDMPDPTPGPGEVLIRIEASGMCGTDVHVHHGYLPCKPPLVAGHEPVGRIEELGAGVRGLRVGDRVGVSWVQKGCGRCRACQTGRELYCPEQQSWMQSGGGNAELMVAGADGCTLVPEGLDPALAAPLFCAGFTVMSGYRNAEPRPGDRVAVLGIGGLGHLAVQIAHAMGHEVLAVTGSPGKADEIRALGADEVVIAGDDPGKALLEAGGVNVILSTTNSARQVGQAFEGLLPEGRLVNMGVVDGPIQIAAFSLMMGQRKLVGSTQNRRADMVEILELAAAGKVVPQIERYPLSEVNAVRERLVEGKVRFRAVMTPN
ncbi:MAG: alcohol dehydrogenase catalytic domain-containing protein [Deltaproteobacteria bacterium]|nr:alcohol dehydrogenase catalytic domain-containing protein [Deltaproteobacteria bacterium]MCB9785471.1 alcohol dehydrogenase catalytic domain-containing protein [Deltaproteobacteria bacterium]